MTRDGLADLIAVGIHGDNRTNTRQRVQHLSGVGRFGIASSTPESFQLSQALRTSGEHVRPTYVDATECAGRDLLESFARRVLDREI